MNRNCIPQIWVFILLFLCAKVTGQQAKIQELDSVIVSTAQFTPQSLKQSVFSISIITAEQIKAKGATNIVQVLNTLPGIRFNNDNTLGTTNIQLFGMSGRSIKVLLDGVPVIDRNDTRESLSQIDVQSIDHIEIIEGPMSVIYGSDALAGIINIITKTPGARRYSLDARVQEETAGKEYHPFSYKGLHQQSLSGYYSFAPLYASGGFNHILFNGFGGDAYGRKKSWLPKEQYLWNIRVGYKTKTHKLYYRLDILDETITTKGEINLSTAKAFDQRYLTKRFMHQLQDVWNISGRFNLSTFLSYTDYTRKTRSTIHDFITGTNELTTGQGEQDIAKFNTLFFRTQGVYTINSMWALQSGVEINRDKASGNRIAGNPTITDVALFASAEIKPLTWLNLRPGFRAIKNSTYDAPPVVPALNVKIAVSPKSDIRLSYAQGYRAPALRELYFDFVDANHSIFGNPNLKAENSKSFNATWHWNTRNDSWNTGFIVTGFYNVFNNLINYAQDPENASRTILFNVDKFKTTGAVLSQTIGYKNLNADWGFTYIGRYNSLKADEQYKALPSFTWSPEITANLYYRFPKPALQLAFMYKYTGSQKVYQSVTSGSTTQVQLARQAAFHWADFTATKTLWKALSVQAGIRNLFNIINVNNTIAGDGAHSTAGPSPIGYGRSYFLSLGYSFRKK